MHRQYWSLEHSLFKAIEPDRALGIAIMFTNTQDRTTTAQIDRRRVCFKSAGGSSQISARILSDVVFRGYIKAGGMKNPTGQDAFVGGRDPLNDRERQSLTRTWHMSSKGYSIRIPKSATVVDSSIARAFEEPCEG